MSKVNIAWLLAAATAVASCSSIAPVRISAGDQCVRCRRYIQDTRLAGEMVYPGGLVEKFRAPGCMAKYLAAYPAPTADVYVTDFTSRKLVAASRAVYVPVLLDRNTGETDYRAYTVRADADAAARELDSQVVDWTTVLDRADR